VRHQFGRRREDWLLVEDTTNMDAASEKSDEASADFLDRRRSSFTCSDSAIDPFTLKVIVEHMLGLFVKRARSIVTELLHHLDSSVFYREGRAVMLFHTLSSEYSFRAFG
jgi:hypothetical protein